MTIRVLILILFMAHPVWADSKSTGGFHFEFGKEYSDYNRPSPKSPPTPSKSRKGGESTFWRRALLYIPNRALDLIDIFKLDVGVGVGYGGVIRPTRYLQAGYRDFDPGMLRIGLMGRRWPVMMEEKIESGFGNEYGRRSSRNVSPGEIGVGIDAGLVGVYGGVSVDSATDFILGIVGLDFEDDDLR